MTSTCAAIATPDTYWNFCPSSPAAYVLAVAFGLTTITHVAQAIYHKKAYCWVIILSALAQTLTYIFRILSIQNPSSFADYAAWFILILVAPLFTNAFVYMVMGRMVWNYVDDAKLYKVTAWRFGLYFVVLDIVAFIIQVYGAASATGGNGGEGKADRVLNGLHIYMAGVGIQQAFILLFLFFAIKFHRTVLSPSRRGQQTSTRSALTLLYSVYAGLTFITIRIVFRLIEYSQGLESTIPSHEVYQYCLDSLPMLLALLLFNVFHPGRLMPGKQSNLPRRKERKAGQVNKMKQYSPSGEQESA